jgi:hypothetical protein
MNGLLHSTARQFICNQDRAQRTALTASKKLADVGERNGHGSGGGKRWFMWMNNRDLRKATSLEEMLGWWRYHAVTGSNGDITGVQFEGEKSGEEKYLWDAIAPFVEPGSYIEMQGEDGVTWRWVFDGKTCQEMRR